MKKYSLGLSLSLLMVGSFIALSVYSGRPRSAEGSEDAEPAGNNQTLDSRPGTGQNSQSERTSAPTTRSVVSAGRLTFPETRHDHTIFADDGQKYPLRKYKAHLVPSDPSGSQWWTTMTGLNSTWDIGAGSKQSLLAIIDTGFALNHEEFTGRWHENTAETGIASAENPSLLNCTDRNLTISKSCNLIDDNYDGVIDNEIGSSTTENKSSLNCSDLSLALDKSCNLVDDDGNGFVDDRHGWDFINLDRSVQAGENWPNATSVGHGTMVAGIAAASGNNLKGISGVDWFTKILPLQALDDDGNGDTLTVSRAIRYAADQGADVISLSLGSEEEDSYLRQAVHYAIKKGSLIVAAAGNEGCECLSYPARYPEVVAVGASDQDDLPAYFSNWGSNLDILAPGIGMSSPTWRSNNFTTAYANNIAGTSFATPLVAGLLTRAKSHQPNASNHQLLAAITELTSRLNIPSGTIQTATLGFGRVDAEATMNRTTTSRQPVQRYGFKDVSGGTRLGAYEPQKSFMLYACESSRPGTTKLYRLAKGSSIIYTISEVERQQSASQGYNETLAGNFCVSLPSDFPQVSRVLSLLQELENRPNKE